jgi:hypothetical protein
VIVIGGVADEVIRAQGQNKTGNKTGGGWREHQDTRHVSHGNTTGTVKKFFSKALMCAGAQKTTATKGRIDDK